MKTKTKLLLGLLALVLILPTAVKSQKVPFIKSSVVPAAEGFVKIKTDRNNNNIIKIRIKNLVEIERLDPSKKTYVVWMITDRDKTENIGRINSTNRLNVSFNAVSSFRPIKIFITAEENENIQEPSQVKVLTTENFWE